MRVASHRASQQALTAEAPIRQKAQAKGEIAELRADHSFGGPPSSEIPSFSPCCQLKSDSIFPLRLFQESYFAVDSFFLFIRPSQRLMEIGNARILLNRLFHELNHRRKVWRI